MSESLPRLGIVLVLGVCAGACTSYHRSLDEDEPTPPRREVAPEAAPAPTTEPAVSPADVVSTSGGPKSAFPGIRVDVRGHIVEFDASVSSLIFEPYEGRSFYLEQFVCKAGTKDHESLLVTDALPSQIHAALLLIGLQPGSPVSWTYPEGDPVVRAPTGPKLDIQFVLSGEDGAETIVDPRRWTIEKDGARRLSGGAWVFAGSTIAGPLEAQFYEADAAGTIVGLAGFGSEVIAWAAPISHEEGQGQLEWIADLEAIPPAQTPLVVRVRSVTGR